MITVYTDGASQGNPGPSGAGVFIQADDETYRFIIPLEEMTNHEAEFYAVIFGLKICQKMFPKRILSFRTDAKVVVDTIEKDFTRNGAFLPLLKEINTLSDSFTYFFIKWIPEKENFHADQLAKDAIHATMFTEVTK